MSFLTSYEVVQNWTSMQMQMYEDWQLNFWRKDLTMSKTKMTDCFKQPKKNKWQSLIDGDTKHVTISSSEDIDTAIKLGLLVPKK